ncbi:cobalt-precorrin-5B (C(1))-methyltransferase [Sporanaerobium hydrogeniformans]|uniref:Cobalt-precorrin-5B (C(1))-methyltransferase n=1 Tax=Sporanaerobium hydrogeniformans TaxID=3072179 RepID=A0AC61DDY1_9FIRM|nr:cobalt-precorrin-5B (C(1))-methyltransferase CbiD [Sporanaerobium hydrogeniformans]PHV71008.1 cobalt-precorrin-5B (C(1))-methyltransferase [Sporanaerobium hydrogeniformans]
MDEYVYIDGKPYRRGYTTGSCATAAAKAAATILLTKELISTISIDTPKGIPLTLKVEDAQLEGDRASCAIRKDGGDDKDATHGTLIYASVQMREGEAICIKGGKGVGIITKPGLGVGVGEAAINKVPREMIQREVRSVIGKRGMEVTIEVPEGESIAKKTFNPRLGIIGGISIIGTSGIVEPMSEEGWKRSLSLELEMKKAVGLKKIVLVGGNHGERFALEVLGLNPQYVVRTSNFVGYMLLEAKRLGYEKILMLGHLGKFIKVAGGIFHTHSKVADARAEILTTHLALMGAPYELFKKVYHCATTEEAIEFIKEAGYSELFYHLANRCKERCLMHLQEEEVTLEVLLFSLQGERLGVSSGFNQLMEEFK